jgi:hypothetical protein
MAVARYANNDKDIQAAYDRGSLGDGFRDYDVITRHAAFDGEYAEQIVRHVLAREYGKRKAFREGYGVRGKDFEAIVDLAKGLYREYRALKVYGPPATPRYARAGAD